MALTTGRALPNQLPSILDRRGLLLGRGVRAMRKCLECGSELESDTDIVLHTCKAYPPKEEVNSWAELFLNNLKREGE